MFPRVVEGWLDNDNLFKAIVWLLEETSRRFEGYKTPQPKHSIKKLDFVMFDLNQSKKDMGLKKISRSPAPLLTNNLFNVKAKDSFLYKHRKFDLV
jgi:hypothetical protein